MKKYFNLSHALRGIIIVMLSLALLACSGDDHDGHSHAEDAEHADGHAEHQEIVRLSEAELLEFAIEIDTAGSGVVRQQLNLTGEIVIDPDRLAHIVPRFPGIVKKVRKKIGDRVRAGEVLAIIESNESLSPYSVTSLISGTIIEMHLTKGEAVSDNNHDIIVADLSYVWADLNAYQKDLEHLQVGQKVVISGGGKVPDYAGKISYISPTLSETRRTATARVIVANASHHWRPGLFVDAEITIASMEVPIAVPGTALERFEGQTVVFVKTDQGFMPRPVTVGRKNHSTVEILNGLKSGELYVSKGGFTLKAELEKGAFGDGHGH